MKVNSAVDGVSMQAGQPGLQQESDMISKNLKNQISELQKELKELSSNTQLGGEEKMKKRQEIQKQISDLNMQLRQRQIELRREKQQEKASSDDVFGTGAYKDGAGTADKGNGLSQASMEAMISADASVKQASRQGSVAAKMEGHARVLESEIKLDSARGGDVSSKQAELAKTEQKAADAATAQLDTLSKADKMMKEAGASEHSTGNGGSAEKAESPKAAEDAGNEKDMEGIKKAENGEDDGGKKNVANAEEGTWVDVRI